MFLCYKNSAQAPLWLGFRPQKTGIHGQQVCCECFRKIGSCVTDDYCDQPSGLDAATFRRWSAPTVSLDQIQEPARALKKHGPRDFPWMKPTLRRLDARQRFGAAQRQRGRPLMRN